MELATTVHLALSMQRPLFLEGEPGTGKAEAAGQTDREEISRDIYTREFLQTRPLLSAIDPDLPPAVLLIDELDRADEPFEAFLLELLADFQISVPEYGTVKAKTQPVVVLT